MDVLFFWIFLVVGSDHGHEMFLYFCPVLIKDNTVPQLTLEGDCTLENSAGANINAGGDADADNSVGGLFHADRIARMFTHHDHCDHHAY